MGTEDEKTIAGDKLRMTMEPRTVCCLEPTEHQPMRGRRGAHHCHRCGTTWMLDIIVTPERRS